MACLILLSEYFTFFAESIIVHGPNYLYCMKLLSKQKYKWSGRAEMLHEHIWLI